MVSLLHLLTHMWNFKKKTKNLQVNDLGFSKPDWCAREVEEFHLLRRRDCDNYLRATKITLGKCWRVLCTKTFLPRHHRWSFSLVNSLLWLLPFITSHSLHPVSEIVFEELWILRFCLVPTPHSALGLSLHIQIHQDAQQKKKIPHQLPSLRHTLKR